MPTLQRLIDDIDAIAGLVEAGAWEEAGLLLEEHDRAVREELARATLPVVDIAWFEVAARQERLLGHMRDLRDETGARLAALHREAGAARHYLGNSEP